MILIQKETARLCSAPFKENQMFFISGAIIGVIIILIFRGPSMQFHDSNKE